MVVEADAFKETDVIYKALSSRGHHDMLQTAELVIFSAFNDENLSTHNIDQILEFVYPLILSLYSD